MSTIPGISLCPSSTVWILTLSSSNQGLRYRIGRMTKGLPSLLVMMILLLSFPRGKLGFQELYRTGIGLDSSSISY